MINELTRGDVRTDGYIFSHYDAKRRAVWRSPEGEHNVSIARTLNKARERAAKLGIEFDLDLEHLHDIYPADGKCPVFGTALVWGQQSGRNNSPSLDRRDPARGYVKGNVAFISNRANRIKSDASKEDLERILSYLN